MQEPSQYNSHRELRKTITLIAGILLLFVGIYMLYKGTAASGAVDFTTPIVKGKIETGSAGLLAIFFGFFVIYLANHDKSEDGGRSMQFNSIIQMILQGGQLTMIAALVIILAILALIYLLEPLRLYLIGLVGFIILLVFRQENR